MAKHQHPGSTTDRAATIRRTLKARGWTSRDVSVRAEYYSIGSSIHVVIKNADVPLTTVERIANEHERVDRDQWGEILSGGNRFVHVSYSHDANDVLTARYAPVILAAARDLDADASDTSLHPIGDTGYLLGRGANGWGYSLWNDGGHIQTANEPAHLAPVLAVQIDSRRDQHRVADRLTLVPTEGGAR